MEFKMISKIEKVTPDLIEDVAKLFGTEKTTHNCWCMWFIISVKEFHAAGSAGNRASFCSLVENSDLPMGLLAYQDREPVGWCAVGPRSRYARAIKTPTYQGGNTAESDIWLVPCFFLRKDVRGQGLTRVLLEAAVDFAQENGAAAIEGFPFAGSKQRSSGDIQVGFEAVFAACGFQVIRTPSSSRAVMRLQLQDKA